MAGKKVREGKKKEREGKKVESKKSKKSKTDEEREKEEEKDIYGNPMNPMIPVGHSKLLLVPLYSISVRLHSYCMRLYVLLMYVTMFTGKPPLHYHHAQAITSACISQLQGARK